MKRLSSLVLVLLILLIVFTGCSKTTEKSSSVTIYVSGESNGIPCYWRIRNNQSEKINLGIDKGVANSIFVANNTIYTAGEYNYRPCYWSGNKDSIKFLGNKNGEVKNGWINSIVVDRNKVSYLAGFSDGKPYYWKGNKANELADSGNAESITVVNDAVYIAGSFGNIPCYWNGDNFICNKLTSTSSVGGTAYSIFVSNNGNIYTAGNYEFDLYYWLGTSTFEKLADDGFIYSIFVTNEGTVYTAGEFNYQSKYMPYYSSGNSINILDKPSNQVQEGDASYSGSATGITVIKDTIYIVGYCSINSNNSLRTIPCCWIIEKNKTTCIELDKVNGRATDICVVQI